MVLLFITKQLSGQNQHQASTALQFEHHFKKKFLERDERSHTKNEYFSQFSPLSPANAYMVVVLFKIEMPQSRGLEEKGFTNSSTILTFV